MDSGSLGTHRCPSPTHQSLLCCFRRTTVPAHRAPLAAPCDSEALYLHRIQRVRRVVNIFGDLRQFYRQQTWVSDVIASEHAADLPGSLCSCVARGIDGNRVRGQPGVGRRHASVQVDARIQSIIDHRRRLFGLVGVRVPADRRQQPGDALVRRDIPEQTVRR